MIYSQEKGSAKQTTGFNDEKSLVNEMGIYMTEEMEKALKAIALHVRNELAKVEKELDEINEKLGTKDLDERIKKLEDKLATKGKVPSNIVDKIQELEGKVSSFYEKLEKKISQPDIEKILDEKLSAKINEIQKAAPPAPTDEKKPLESASEYARKMESLKNQFEGVHAEFEKRFSQLNTEAEKKFSAMSSSLEKRFEEKIKASEPAKGLEGRIEFIEKELKNLRKTEKEVEEEGAILAAVDKKIRDMDLLTKDIEAKIEHAAKLDPDKALEAKATKIFTKHLDDFSRVMDRRFPSLVTRDDMYKTISDINSRLDNIEAPDLAPLAQKVDYLEKKIGSIYDMLKSISSRIPVIVE